ncbi:MAG: CPBP family intramembrane glutamic endopeptidase [Planctomycetota bacterium]|jgi:membrane protease YdiL (CAAX protease family)
MIVKIDKAFLKKNRIFELCAVLCIGFLPFFFFALVDFVFPVESKRDFIERELGNAIISISILIPVLYIMWRSELSWKDFGVVKIDLLVDTFFAGILFCASYFSWQVIVILFPKEGLYRPSQPDYEPGFLIVVSYGVTALALILNSFAEEFVMRSYLITRLSEIMNSRFRPVLIAAFLFGSYHIYQGFRGALAILILGLIYGTYFAAFRKVWPLIIAHTVHNFFVFFPFRS